MPHTQPITIFTAGDAKKITHTRKFETKIGETIQVLSNPLDIAASLQLSKARYVIVGVIEDIGIMANGGVHNPYPIWQNFVEALLNFQSNDFLSGEEMLLLGHFNLTEIGNVIEQSAASNEEKLIAYRHATSLIDEALEPIVKLITYHKKLPIVIGKGQNNAYPCIKGAAKGWHTNGVIPIAQINTLCFSTTTGYGAMEGRHSGNPFRYAEEDGFLEKLCVVGVEENSIPQNVWIDFVNNPFADCITYEDIFVLEKKLFGEAVNDAINFTDDTLVGVELNLSIDYTTENCQPLPRQFLSYVVMAGQPAYLHICEGDNSVESEKEAYRLGSQIAVLVSDFVKGMQGSYEGGQ